MKLNKSTTYDLTISISYLVNGNQRTFTVKPHFQEPFSVLGCPALALRNSHTTRTPPPHLSYRTIRAAAVLVYMCGHVEWPSRGGVAVPVPARHLHDALLLPRPSLRLAFIVVNNETKGKGEGEGEG
jgi:hypothetical protein